MTKARAIVYGRKGCHLCDNRKQVLEKFPAYFKKSTGQDINIQTVPVDVGTVDGLVQFCAEERTNADIPVVVLEDDQGQTLKVYHGPTGVVSSRDLMDVFSNNQAASASA
jgi:hypothetical protein